MAGSFTVDHTNPHVFFDIAIDGRLVGRLVIELFMEACPRTVENFRALCTGEKGAIHGRPICYKGTPFHYIVPDLVCQGGDFMNHDGSAGCSIYGDFFEDETYAGRAGSHFGFGCVSMAKQGRLNGSQFFFCLQPLPHLDGKHVVVGRVIRGLEVLKQMGAAGTPSGVPSKVVVIAQCGQES
eukprot:GGOE01019328.1.p2 GENE.GGOE01019328.1~~GGOE01019328.1.p2  ORF type:complete len:182 (-),score=56.63 GGOE01019328.1:245-790(-)